MELPQDRPKQPSDGFSGPPLARTEGVPDKGGRLKRLLRRPLFPSRLRLQEGRKSADLREEPVSQATAASAPDPSEQVAVGNMLEIPLIRCLRVVSSGQAGGERCA